MYEKKKPGYALGIVVFYKADGKWTMGDAKYTYKKERKINIKDACQTTCTSMHAPCKDGTFRTGKWGDCKTPICPEPFSTTGLDPSPYSTLTIFADGKNRTCGEIEKVFTGFYKDETVAKIEKDISSGTGAAAIVGAGTGKDIVTNVGKVAADVGKSFNQIQHVFDPPPTEEDPIIPAVTPEKVITKAANDAGKTLSNAASTVSHTLSHIWPW